MTRMGAQTPRYSHIPPSISNEADAFIDLADSAGLHLDPWQQNVLRAALGVGDDGKWAALRVGLVVGRQNGKGALLEALELGWLFLTDEELILHTAQDFNTCLEAFLRMEEILETNEFLRRHVDLVRSKGKTSVAHRGAGRQGFHLKNGHRLLYKTRTVSAGRGFSCDKLVVDEAMFLGREFSSAVIPTLSARTDVTARGPQIWYTGSAGFEHSTSLGDLRNIALAGGSNEMAWMEWSVPDDSDPADPDHWYTANPALGIRLTEKFVRMEQQGALGPEEFRRERLGIGTWPVDGQAWEVIPKDAWDALEDRGSMRNRDMPVAFAVDTTPDRGMTSVAVVGKRGDDLYHVEIMWMQPGTGWVLEWLLQRIERWRPCTVVIDPSSAAGSLIGDLVAESVEFQQRTGIDLDELVLRVTATDLAQACGQFYEMCVETKMVRHIGQRELANALSGAQKKPSGDAWRFERKGEINISPLMAAVLALRGHQVHGADGAGFNVW